MKLHIADTNEALSKQIADDLIQLIDKKEHPLLCTASGDSPAGLYKELIKRVHQTNLNVADWYFVGLDEWGGMNGSDEGSCRYHLDQQLFDPLQIAKDRISFFDGRNEHKESECERVETFIQQQGGIDVAIIGLGLNGHIGMNEPGTSSELKAHVAKIDPQTQQVGQKYFNRQVELSTGLTLGIADLMAARYVFLIVNGRHKADIVKKMLDAPISEELPASLLRNHPGFYLYLDQQAASLLHSERLMH